MLKGGTRATRVKRAGILLGTVRREGRPGLYLVCGPGLLNRETYLMGTCYLVRWLFRGRHYGRHSQVITTMGPNAQLPSPGASQLPSLCLPTGSKGELLSGKTMPFRSRKIAVRYYLLIICSGQKKEGTERQQLGWCVSKPRFGVSSCLPDGIVLLFYDTSGTTVLYNQHTRSLIPWHPCHRSVIFHCFVTQRNTANTIAGWLGWTLCVYPPRGDSFTLAKRWGLASDQTPPPAFLSHEGPKSYSLSVTHPASH